MERRLLNFAFGQSVEHSGAVPQESPEALRQMILEQQKNNRNAASDTIVEELKNKLIMLTNDPKEREKLWQDLTTGMLSRLTTLTQEFADLMKGAGGPPLQDLSKEFSLPEDKAMFKDILRSLSTKPRTHLAGGDPHPYLLAQSMEKEDGSGLLYFPKVKFDVIKEHQTFLQKLMLERPDLQPILEKMKAGLEQFLREDKRKYAEQAVGTLLGKGNYADRVIGKVGKMTGFILAATVALTTGTYMILQKKILAAPFLAAGVAALLGSPRLRRMLTEGKEEQSFAEVDAVLNNKSFLRICREYGIKDVQWEKLAGRLMEDDMETNEMLTKLRAKKPEALTADITKYAKRLAKSDATVQRKLEAMILDGRFSDFVRSLRSSPNEDVRQVVRDYIKLGSWEYRTDLDEVAAAGTSLAQNNALASGTDEGLTLPPSS